jgi:DNA repair exonuclease SbcCD nuclease subunit
VALHGWSYPEAEGPVDVAAQFPAALGGFFNIGLLHTSAEGRCGHQSYAPCSRITLRHHGYDYWALGHVHARELVSTEPWIVFPGNLQGRGPREAGDKGATLVRVSRGQVKEVVHRPLCCVRFQTVVVEAESARHFDDVLQLAALALMREKREAAGPARVVRLVIEGVEAAVASLEVSPWVRNRALHALARELSDENLWLDETWVNAGAGGSWRLDAAA